MAIYAVCLGMTLAVKAKSREEAIEKARTELQYELDHGVAGQEKGVWDFDTYDVSKMAVSGGIITFD
jgi:hypothetical protein